MTLAHRPFTGVRTRMWRASLLACLVASTLTSPTLSHPTAATTAAAARATSTLDEEYPCVHDRVAAAQAAGPNTHPVYVRTVYNSQYRPPASADGTASETKDELKKQKQVQPEYRDLLYTPRRSATAASLDFTINGAATAAAAVGDPAPEAENEWKPIRVRAFFEDLLDTSRYCTAIGDMRPDYAGNTISCTSASDILTEKKRSVLMNALIPAAISMHASRLNVKRVPDGVSLVIGGMSGAWCSSFTVPPAHRTEGVADADFVVYVAAGPTSTPSSFVAWAIGCQSFPESGRPAVGAIYFNPRFLVEEADETLADIANGGNANSVLENRARVAAHELLHALGFNYATFNRQGLVTTVNGLRGKPTALVLNSTNVRRAALEHFGCYGDDAAQFPGMELEDMDSSGTTSSHWKRRNMRDELMSPVANLMRYSDITLAAMADLGYYTVQPNKGEYLGWGNKAGCAMVTEKCVETETESSTAPSEFCVTMGQTSSSRMCTRDRLSIGRCYITTYSKMLPAYMQYFDSPTTGGGENFVDYCPTVQRYGNTGCFSGSEEVMPGSVTGDTARCFDVDPGSSLVTKADFGQQGAVCATVQCNFTTSTYHVQFRGATGFVACTPGATVDPSETSPTVFQAGGRVVCPSFLDVCSGNARAGFTLPADKPGDGGNGSDAARAAGASSAAWLLIGFAMVLLWIAPLL